MQPPPRKGNYAKFLKNLHTEQINKLQLKNQHECDLLEDIRTFVIKRSAIEKSYSEALLKISSAYLNKKIPNIPDIKLDGGEEKWNMWNVWRTVLEENEKLARARLAAVEVFQQQIADDAKLLRAHKIQTAKKCVDHLAIVQKELQNCVQDVDKTKKLYFDEEHGAHEVRDKARDIEEKLKKKKGSFFQSITSLQKNSAKFSTKRDQLEEKSTGARNDYLLCLAAANAHQTRYFVVDLQQCMQAMESGVYEKVAEYLTLMGRTELLTCSAMQNSFSTIRDQAKQLTREYNLQCCYLFYPVLKQHITYDFDRCDDDPVDKVTAPSTAECQETLSKEARRWATRIARDVNTIRECTRKLQMYNTMREQGQKTDPNDPNGPDLETKIDDLKMNIRRAETSKAKAEARIECLRQGGVNVDEWMREAESLNVQDIQRSASSLSDHPSSDSYYDSDFAEGDGATVPVPAGAEPASARRDSSDEEVVRRESQSEHQYESADVDAVLEQEKQRIENLTAGWDDPTQVDWGGAEDAAEDVESADLVEKRASVPLLKCTALYSYTAQHPDELTIVENEQLEVVGEGDGDGWLRARNYRGEEGFVPQNYLDIEREPPVVSASGTPALVNQISFSSVDYTVDNDDTQRQAETATQSPEQISVISAGKGKEGEKEETTEYCVAMYDYDGEGGDDELTFEEGQVIRILSRQAHSVDDGWWRGELEDGKVGNFPSLVVEECNESGELLEDPEWDEEAPISTPPVPQWSGVPPDVVPSLPPDEVDGMDTLEDDIVSSPPQQPPPAPPAEVLEELAAMEAMESMEYSPIQNGFSHEDAFSEKSPVSSEPQPPAVQSPSHSSSSTSKAAHQKQQGFEMKMTRDQYHQYGSQFDGGHAPAVPVIDVPCVEVFDEDAEETTRLTAPSTGGDDFGLCAASIVITAATPMIEEAEHPFPPVEESAVNHTEETKSAKTSSSVSAPAPAPATATTEAEDVDKSHTEAESKRQSEDVEEMPASTIDDHQNFAVSSSTGSDGETTGPSTAENSVSQAPPTECDSAPKQVVGGRASIPDELEPHQLARLQDLKESNA